MADGTAQKCGRVGSCHIHLKPFSLLKGFFILYIHAMPKWAYLTIIIFENEITAERFSTAE
jgi:hypothetical protein